MEQMRRNQRGAVADAVRQLRRHGIGCQLHSKIDAGQQRDPFQRNTELTLEGQKQQRRKIIDDRLTNIPNITGVDRMLII